MAATEFALGAALAVQRWSTSLAVEAEVKQYFRRFMGTGDNALIKVQTELNKKAGEKITVALCMKLSGDGIEDDNVIEGTSAEEALTFFDDSLFIGQRRKGTKSKGKMSEQRVPYNMRRRGRNALAVWWGEDYDQQIIMYLSGARGVDTSFHVDTSWTGRASNTLTAPESTHQIYGGNASAKNDLDSADKMHLQVVEKALAKAETLDPMMRPLQFEGENKFVMLMHTYQAYDLRTSISANDWIDIQKSAGARGDKNLVYKNALGEYAGVILHKHRNVVRFSDYGAAGDVVAGRALFLAAHAGIIAWGGGGAYGRYSWNEELDDRGNALVLTAGAIYGVKKSIYNSLDFGVVACDTYCKDPNG